MGRATGGSQRYRSVQPLGGDGPECNEAHDQGRVGRVSITAWAVALRGASRWP